MSWLLLVVVVIRRGTFYGVHAYRLYIQYVIADDSALFE